MLQLLEMREWVIYQCRQGNQLSCADLLNKIDEILEYDEDIAEDSLNLQYELE